MKHFAPFASIFLLKFIVLTFCSQNVVAKENTAALNKKIHTQHILFIGDSHSVGIFGHALTNLLRDNASLESKLTTIASCGSSPSWWLEGKRTACGFWRKDFNGSEQNNIRGLTPNLIELMNTVQPKTVIIALGSNLVPLSKSARLASTEAMMSEVSNRTDQCIWIGPPDARKFNATEINDVYVLLNHLSHKYDCKLIDSRKYTHYPKSGGDGLHYGGKEGTLIAKEWASNVYWNEIRQVL